MIACLICEKEVADDRLGPHSAKCRELAESKELLKNIVIKMENHSEKAEKMRNTLETHTAKRQIIRSKRNSSRDFLDTSIRVRSSNSLLGTPNPSTLRHLNDTEEDGKDQPLFHYRNSIEKTLDKTCSTQETQGPLDESIKKIKEEDDNFTDEARKSMNALKQVIFCADDIAKWAFEITTVCQVGHDTKSELQEYEKEIRDAKVSEFLGEFIHDLEDYLKIKAKYLDQTMELMEINSPKLANLTRPKLGLKKSTSFRNKPGASMLTFGKSKREELPAISTLAKKKETPSPSLEKRKLSPKLTNVLEMSASPSLQKRTLNKESGVQSVMSLTASPAGKTLKVDKSLLFTNVNHMAGMSTFSNMGGLRKNPDDGVDSLRERIKKINQNQNNGMEIGLMTPLMTPSTSAHKLPKGRVNIGGITPLSLYTQGRGEGKGLESANANVKKEETKPKAGNSIAWFKSIRNEDKNTGFASKNNSRNSSVDESSPKSNVKSPVVQIPMIKFKKCDDFLESPSLMKGYYSDCNTSKNRRRITRADSNDVGWDDFEIIKEVGKGAYGTVWLVKKKATGKMYAMKTVDWADRFTQNRLQTLKTEKDIYQELVGDFVVKAIWTFHYENFICFVMEYMLGGDFNKVLDRVAILEEDQAQFYFAELVLAVESLHKIDIVHRDLKPDNILMDAKGHIKLTDFGLSQKGFDRLRGSGTPNRKSPYSSPKDDFIAKSKMNMLSRLCKDPETKNHIEFKQKAPIFGFLGGEEEYHLIGQKKKMINKKNAKESSPLLGSEKKPKMVGTPDYMAPEIIAPEKYDLEGYDEKCMDFWSMGCILYQFLVGIPPFCDTSVEAVFDNIKNLRMEWPSIGEGEDCISHTAADLIKKLLNPDPKKRLGANGIEEIKEHQFFIGVDWEELREREAPIIPCSMNDLDEKEEKEKKTPGNSGSQYTSPPNCLPITRAQTAKPLDFGAFQMRRLDVLDQHNQENFKEVTRQKSQKINLRDLL